MISTFFFCLIFSQINIGTFDSRPSDVASDSTETQTSSNSITVKQKGSGNSVSISQSGSKTKTTATIESSGENNYAEITSGSDTLQTEVSFQGKSNNLVVHPGPWRQIFSIKTTLTPATGQSFPFAEFYFIFNRPEKSIHIHQTPDGVRINEKKQ